MTSTPTLDAAAVIAAARRRRAAIRAESLGLLEELLTWVRMHVVTDVDDAATWAEAPVPLAGEGAPLIAEFCVEDMAAALGWSPDRCRRELAAALELEFRLPLVLARVRAGDLEVWRACKIAEQTSTLSAEAAAYVDAQLAPFVHKTGPAAVERLIESAIARFMPEYAAEIAERAADGRHVTIHHDQRSFSGTSYVEGELDFADAVDLETALQAGAESLKAGGSEDSLDVRRALALGVLARGQGDLGLEQSREVVFYVHLEPDADDAGFATVEATGAGTHLVTRETVARWCSDGATVTVRPVIDLAADLTSAGYHPSDTLREHVVLRDGTCRFPWCTRSARRGDLDHIDPWDSGGPTSSRNLAALCRRHHRLKTLGRWSYTQVEPGVFLWRSPLGHTYLRDRHGTQDLTPRPVEPPGLAGRAASEASG